jgi:hypothetical protein
MKHCGRGSVVTTTVEVTPGANSVKPKAGVHARPSKPSLCWQGGQGRPSPTGKESR